MLCANLSELEVKAAHACKVEEDTANLIGSCGVHAPETVVEADIACTVGNWEEAGISVVIFGNEGFYDGLTEVVVPAASVQFLLLT